MNFTEFLEILERDAAKAKNIHISVVKGKDKETGRPMIDIRRKGRAPHLDLTLAKISYTMNGYGKASRCIALYNDEPGVKPTIVCQDGARMANMLLAHLGRNMDVSEAKRFYVNSIKR